MVKQYNFELWIASKLFICGLLSYQAAWAQVIPDGTTVTPDPGSCQLSCTITGGTLDTTGTNLFHSFSQFSIPNGSVVTFDHDPTVVNILARVANGPLSTIDGVIRTDVTSSTNLFLMNPEGIVFGPNGSLDLGGSFVATTADAIQFGNQGNFSTNDITSDLALLTVSPSALLFSQSTPQPIINQSTAFNITPTSFTIGLRVPENNSLLLVGGDVILEKSPNGFLGGNITAPNGRLELGGVNGAATIGLKIASGSLSLSYPDNVSLADVVLDTATLNLSNDLASDDELAGSLVITANSISFSNASAINSTTDGSGNAGGIALQAKESVTFDNSNILITTEGTGNGGSLLISTDSLFLENSSFNANTNGAGNGGEISLVANNISLSNSNIVAIANGDLVPAGNAGQVAIQTSRLFLLDSSTIQTQTLNTATNIAAGGGININAQEFVSLNNNGSSIISATAGQRNASDIIINTPELAIQDFASISAVSNLSTSITTEGNAGNIIVNGANHITLSNGFITTETNTLGRGGNIILNADQLTADSRALITATATATADVTTQGGSVTLNVNQIDLSGETTGILAETQGPAAAGLINIAPNANAESLTVTFQEDAEISAATSSSGAGGRVTVLAPDVITLSGKGRLSTLSTESGPAGDISLQTNGQIRIEDGARIEVSGAGTGNSGTLDIVAGTTVLNNGQLLASTQAGDDGNITLNIDDVLILRNESLISAAANNNANGGNVDITAPFIIALFPNGPNGNDIKASADAGNGGLITIQANTLFNLAINQAIPGNQTNDLDATSGTGIDGDVIITTLDLDPDQGTNPLPSGLRVPDLSQGCQASNNGQFIATGQGGLSATPYTPLSNNGIQADIYPASQTIANQTGPGLVEAQQWTRNPQGNVVLLAAHVEEDNRCW